MKKSDVNGDNTNEVYKWLKNEKSGILGLTRIKVKTTTSYSYSMTYPKKNYYYSPFSGILRCFWSTRMEKWWIVGRLRQHPSLSMVILPIWLSRVFFFFSWIAAVVCMYVWVILSLELKASSITPPVTCFLTETPLYLARFWKISYFLPLPTSCDKPDLINWIYQLRSSHCSLQSGCLYYITIMWPWALNSRNYANSSITSPFFQTSFLKLP